MVQLNDFRLDVKGTIEQQMIAYLTYYGFTEVAEHSLAVAAEAKILAAKFSAEPKSAYIAGLLHDSSVFIPNKERVALCQTLNLSVYPEEKQVPMLLHQRLSKVLANEFFGVTDVSILNAIECHTTLRNSPSKMDLIVFLADKLQWDQSYAAPYLDELNKALETSLIHGAKTYIDWTLKKGVLVLHPWLSQAKQWLDEYEER